MSGISLKLKNWWQERYPVRGGDQRVSQDMLHLFRLRREHRLLRLRIEGVAGEFQSLLLEVDMRGQRLLLDEPFPLPLPLDAMSGRRAQVSSNEGPASTRFESPVLGKAVQGEVPVLALALPLSVSAAQRRNSYRLAVDERMPVAALLRVAGVGSLDARVLDLSVQGIRLEIPGHHPGLRESTAPLVLRLGAEQGMLCQLQIRSLHLRSLSESSTILGGRLDGLNPPQLQQIERFIARCQRSSRQREMALAL